MLKDLLETATSTFDEQERKQLIRQMVSFPDEIIPIAHEALHQPPLVRQEVAIEIFRELGYPANALIIPDLIIHLGDPNRLGWDAAVETLEKMGPDVVVPHLIQALLDPKKYEYSYADIEGLCFMLKQVDPEFARRCCPAINYLLSQRSLAECIDSDFLLDVIERAGSEQTYVLPALFELQKITKRDDIAERIQCMIATFPSDTRANYALYASDQKTN
jgi:HEAT repeat protein